MLLQHPKVGDAAVFGIPNEDWGEEVKAVVRHRASPALAQEIMEVRLKNAAKYKCPKSISILSPACRVIRQQALQAQAARPVLAGPGAVD